MKVQFCMFGAVNRRWMQRWVSLSLSLRFSLADRVWPVRRCSAGEVKQVEFCPLIIRLKQKLGARSLHLCPSFCLSFLRAQRYSIESTRFVRAHWDGITRWLRCVPSRLISLRSCSSMHGRIKSEAGHLFIQTERNPTLSVYSADNEEELLRFGGGTPPSFQISCLIKRLRCKQSRSERFGF